MIAIQVIIWYSIFSQSVQLTGWHWLVYILSLGNTTSYFNMRKQLTDITWMNLAIFYVSFNVCKSLWKTYFLDLFLCNIMLEMQFGYLYCISCKIYNGTSLGRYSNKHINIQIFQQNIQANTPLHMLSGSRQLLPGTSFEVGPLAQGIIPWWRYPTCF